MLANISYIYIIVEFIIENIYFFYQIKKVLLEKIYNEDKII